MTGNALADFQERKEQELFQHTEERAFRADSVTLKIVTTRGDSLVELDIIWVDWDEWVGTSALVAVRLLNNGRWVPYDAEVW